jgi:hypothetical protein
MAVDGARAVQAGRTGCTHGGMLWQSRGGDVHADGQGLRGPIEPSPGEAVFPRIRPGPEQTATAALEDNARRPEPSHPEIGVPVYLRGSAHAGVTLRIHWIFLSCR